MPIILKVYSYSAALAKRVKSQATGMQHSCLNEQHVACCRWKHVSHNGLSAAGKQPTATLGPQSQHLKMKYDGVIQGPVATAQPAQSRLTKLANVANTPLGKVAIAALGMPADTGTSSNIN